MEKIVPLEGEDIETLCFGLEHEVYGVNILDVEEVVKVKDITPLPISPPFIVGITSLRGVVVPVVDLSIRLGFKGKSMGNKMVVLNSRNKIFSILVDEILFVTRFSQNSLEPPPHYITGREFIKGLGRHNDTVVIILETEVLSNFER